MYPVPPGDRLKVPYFGNRYPECDEDNFEEFPSQHQFDVSSLRAQGNTHDPADLDNIGAFLQSWLVFGLMRRIFGPSGINVSLGDFVFAEGSPIDEKHEDEGQVDEELVWPRNLMVDTSENLALYLLYLKAKELRTLTIDPPRSATLWTRHAAAFAMTNSVINDLISWRTDFYPLSDAEACELPALDTLILSIVLLCEWLYYTSRNVFSIVYQVLEWNLDNATRHRLLRAGWCLGEVTVLNNKFYHTTSLYSVGGFDRRALKRDHSSCDVTTCAANYVDASTYRTRHVPVSHDCTCAHLGETTSTSSSTARVLDDGRIPVIRVHQVSTTALSTDVKVLVDDSGAAPYVAISHVWSDGLGNPQDNTLPQCQLLRLQHWVGNLYDESSRPVPFWIDTICVPREMRSRKLAIRRMVTTYKDADKVLVVDSWLLQTGLCGYEEWDMLKFKACTWNQRVWTLQEAMLTRHESLYFQTADGAVNEKDIMLVEPEKSWMWTERVIKEQIGVGNDSDTLKAADPATAEMILRRVERSIRSLESTGHYEHDEHSSPDCKNDISLFQELER